MPRWLQQERYTRRPAIVSEAKLVNGTNGLNEAAWRLNDLISDVAH
jgi:hypothetical protein